MPNSGDLNEAGILNTEKVRITLAEAHPGAMSGDSTRTMNAEHERITNQSISVARTHDSESVRSVNSSFFKESMSSRARNKAYMDSDKSNIWLKLGWPAHFQGPLLNYTTCIIQFKANFLTYLEFSKI